MYINIEFYKMEKSGHYPDMSIWIICSSTKRAFPFFKIVHQSNSQFANLSFIKQHFRINKSNWTKLPTIIQRPTSDTVYDVEK